MVQTSWDSSDGTETKLSQLKPSQAGNTKDAELCSATEFGNFCEQAEKKERSRRKEKSVEPSLAFPPRKFARLALCPQSVYQTPSSSSSSLSLITHHSLCPYLILSHFLSSHLLLHLFSNFIFHLPPSPPPLLLQISPETQIRIQLRKTCQLHLCSWIFSFPQWKLV